MKLMKLKVKDRRKVGKDVVVTFEFADQDSEHSHAFPLTDAIPYKIGSVWEMEFNKTLVREAG